LARSTGLDKDCGIAADASETDALATLDNFLCELKELQIRDGLHIFGISPDGGRLTDLLVALARVPRGSGKGRDASLIRALAADLGLKFDPLDCVLGDVWRGARPPVLADADTSAWRTNGDTVERLEALAQALVGGMAVAAPGWNATQPVLAEIESRLRPDVAACGGAESRPNYCANATRRIMATGPNAWRCRRGALPICAPAAMILPRRWR
jgi:cobaltochelatase CobN